MEQNSQHRKGLLDYLIPLCPLWFPYTIGIYYRNLVEFFEYEYLRFKRFYNFLKESQWWPKEKLEEYQAERLRALIKYVFENVPYYQEIFRERKLKPEDITSVSDLRKLPILSREDVINNFDKLIAKNISYKELKRRFILGYTSGSTGKAMKFYLDKRFKFMDKAFYKWHLSLANFSLYDRYIRLWSRPFIEKRLKTIYLHEPYKGYLSLSTVPTTMGEFKEYLRLIQEFKPVYIRGSPSFLYQLANYAQEIGDDTIRIRVFFNNFENLYPFQRAFIQKQFHCEIFNYYSSEEFLIYAIECNKHEGMHIEIRKGIMEIVNEDKGVLDNEQQGRIICTGLNNYAMPLIRYDIGDIGSISNRPCSCGRGLPLLKSLDGRSSEIIRYNGKCIYPATLFFILERFSNIKECQFVQDREDAIKINVVKREAYSSKDSEGLIKSLKHLIDKDLNLEIHFVGVIPRTKMGKFQFVINHLLFNKQN